MSDLGFSIEPNPHTSEAPISSDAPTPASEEPSQISDTPSPAPSESSLGTPAAEDQEELLTIGGRQVPVSEVLKAMGLLPADTSATSTPAAVLPPATPDPVAARLDALETLIKSLANPQQRAPDPTQVPQAPPAINPINSPREWMQLRHREYLDKGYQAPSQQQLELDLSRAQNWVNHQQFTQLQTELTTERENARIAKETALVQREVDKLAEEFPNVQGEVGQQVLNAFLAQAAQQGQMDLRKVVQTAHDLIGRWVMDRYGNRKKSNIRALSGGMPRGGGIRPPTKKDYGTGFDSFDRMAEDRAKGG